MLYHLTKWVNDSFDPPGFGIFQYISFRAAMAAITAMFISFTIGPLIIRRLKRSQIGEQKKLELTGVGQHHKKAGTPTMGGLIILFAMLAPTLMWSRLNNIYVILILFITAGLGLVGFLDDYLKVIKKKPKGLPGRFKLVGQFGIGLIVGCVIYFFPQLFSDGFDAVKSLTTIPFATDSNLDFGILYIPFVMFIMASASNGINLSDGLDGLAIGLVGIAGLAFLVVVYITGNAVYSDYLNIIYLPNSGEMTIFMASLVGATLGFLWFNSHPAQVFMGDTGSLALGGALGGIAILVKKEFLLPIAGGIFFMESLSVIIQVLYFKYTRWKFGEGRRLFNVAPLHHHFEKLGWHESKIVIRFYIIAVILAIITMTTFKIR